MADGRIADLDSRGVVAVGGPDAAGFLDNLLTTDASGAGDGRAVYAALLAPQGKILFDFIVFRDGERFLLDVARPLVPDLVKRLGMYRLRAKSRHRRPQRRPCRRRRHRATPPRSSAVRADPPSRRWAGAASCRPVRTWRRTMSRRAADYERHRIASGIPAGGCRLRLRRHLPHDAAMDHLNGVDFRKELLHRPGRWSPHAAPRHRAAPPGRGSRRRPRAGHPVSEGDTPIGAIGSATGDLGVAIVRLDRAREARDGGVPLMAAGAPVALSLPAWAGFDGQAAARRLTRRDRRWRRPRRNLPPSVANHGPATMPDRPNAARAWRQYPDAGSTFSTPRRSTSRSPTSHADWPRVALNAQTEGAPTTSPKSLAQPARRAESPAIASPPSTPRRARHLPDCPECVIGDSSSRRSKALLGGEYKTDRGPPHSPPSTAASASRVALPARLTAGSRPPTDAPTTGEHAAPASPGRRAPLLRQSARASTRTRST
jgi:hypothetical protein